MRLLFDQNLSHRLVSLLADIFPDSQHGRNVGLKEAEDAVIWDYARREGFVIVSKDTDFHQRSFLFGPPPKVIWVRLGNCSTRDVADLLRKYVNDIERFHHDPVEALLVLTAR